MTITTRDLTKTYLLKTALDGVSVSFAGGKIHALVGENGAGKSTLAGILSGDIRATSGDILLDGTPAAFQSAKDALRAGIVLVHQCPMLADGITAKENIILQLQATRAKQPLFLRAPTAAMLSLRDQWSPALNLNALVKDLGGNMRFYVSLLGALLLSPRALLLDEPSAFLDNDERKRLYAHLRTLADSGTTIIVITHSRAEATTYADTVTLLQHGSLAGHFSSHDEYRDFLAGTKSSTDSGRCPTDEHRLEILEGESLPPSSHFVAHLPPSPRACRPKTRFRGSKKSAPSVSSVESVVYPPPPALTLSQLSSRPKNRPALLDATLSVHFGEMTAVTGLQEAALDTLEDAVTGMETAYAKGTVTLARADGTKTTLPAHRLTPHILRAHRTAIVPSDRNFRAANPHITVEQLLSVYTKTDTHAAALSLIAQAQVNITPEQLVSNLSGGMLQRLILTRELALNPALVILCNPMQGLDMQAQRELCQTLVGLAEAGKAILLLGTQEFPLSLCQKVYTLESGVTHLCFSHAPHTETAE